MNRQGQISKQGVIVGFITGLILSFCFQFMNGCSVMNEHRLPPKDWPELKITVEETGFWKTQEICERNPVIAILVGPMLGCAWVNFDDMTCKVYLLINAALEHELLHCKGYDHYGSTHLRDHWENWKKANPDWRVK